MAKRKLHFERIPVETVKKIAKLDLPDTDQDGTRRVKEKCRSFGKTSSKSCPSETKYMIPALDIYRIDSAKIRVGSRRCRLLQGDERVNCPR